MRSCLPVLHSVCFISELCWVGRSLLCSNSGEAQRRNLQLRRKVSGLFGRKCFYLTTHSTHFIYGYMVSDIWLRAILIVRKETRCRHIGYSLWLTAKVLLYAPSHSQDNTYYGLCYTSRGGLAGTTNSSMGPTHEGSIRRPISPWANALTTELHLAPACLDSQI